MMDKQAAAKLSAIFTSDAVKGHMKRDRTLQTAKLNASLASKIKTKLINNSSMFKVSLKQNNKALALALSVEKESSRKLKNEKIFLQKEVEKLQLQNTLLLRKLSCLNKTLIEIEAFLNDNLLAAIEISGHSENFQSSLLSDGPSSCTDDQLKNMCQSAGSVELPVKLPLLARSTGRQQGSPSVCEIPNCYKSTTILSKEMHSDEVQFALSLPSDKNNQKLNEIDQVETTIDKNIFLEENQLCREVNCNSAFPTHVNNSQSLRQSEELMEQHNDRSLLFHGNGTERKKHATLYMSKTQPNIKDFDKKCSSDLLHHGSSSSNINDMNLQESSSGLSHVIPSPLEFSSECKMFKLTLLTDKIKPEETIYDADMELTASDAGELLTVTSKDKDKSHPNKNNNANSDKILANFRRVKYSKKDKEKIKSRTEVGSNLYAEERHARADNNKLSKTADSQAQLFRSQTDQLPTGNSVGKQSLLNTNDYYQAQNCPGKTKDTRRTYLANLVHPRNQEKETNTETFSETFEDVESKMIKADSDSSSNKIPAQVYCAESLAFQDNTSNALPLQQDFLRENEKHIKPKINRKIFQNPSKMNTAKYCRVENRQYGEYGSKKSQTERCQHDSKRKQDQKNIIKSKCNKKGSYRQRETENDSVHKITEKDRRSSSFSPGRLKHTLAKASRKAHIIPTKDLSQFSLSKSEELKNKDALCTQAVHGNKVTETRQSQVASVAQNGVAMNILQTKASAQVDDSTDMLKRVDSSPVAHKNPNISNSPDNRVKNKGSFNCRIMETRSEKNCFRHVDQGQLNVLGDWEVPHEIDSFVSKLKPTVQKSEFLKFLAVYCSKNMPLNTGSLFQEGLSSVELPALDNPNASMNFSILKNSEILDKNDQDAGKAEQKLDHVSKETYEKILAPGHGRTALQDLTNTTVCSHASHTSLSKSPKILEESSAAPVRRGRATICYKEPNLSRKLRRGDQFTDTQFLHSPVYKVKNKRSFKNEGKTKPSKVERLGKDSLYKEHRILHRGRRIQNHIEI